MALGLIGFPTLKNLVDGTTEIDLEFTVVMFNRSKLVPALRRL
jgi:hypothetical protein